ncbi:pro-sigmaK processing inhibitor BofA family protein [Methanobacterium sp. ACI-7]|uniref:pro-sigmaK processing inhibitor BofA family protein n=1 Tax=unclassified Methanobacterium TaxID=2627676 RepID=UPI0039C28AB2
MALDIISLAVIVIIAAIGILILLKVGGLLLKIIVHAIFGWIILVLVNLIPTVNIPINILTVLVAGIGGVFGVILLLILQFFGINLAI